MKKLTIKSDRVVTKVVIESDYKVLRGFITKNLTGKKICLVYDKNATACMTEVKESLKGYDVIETSYGEGENVKTAENLLALCKLLCDNEFTRGDAIIAVGGGAVSDLAGFAASIYKRGIKYVNCPTTLLSAIDASVGGKTAVDFGGGKNVLGEFYAPAAVRCAFRVEEFTRKRYPLGQRRSSQIRSFVGENHGSRSRGRDNRRSYL